MVDAAERVLNPSAPGAPVHQIHHIHQRKRQHVLSTYPHPNPWVRFLDRFLLVVAIVSPLVTAPQIYSIIASGSAAGVSRLTWSCFALFNIPWLVYGIVHKEKPIIVAYILWLIVNSAVVALTFIY
jgi:uncharacterized protein with PQ loop repeat